jgi:trimeric autotransporter adhesin
MKTTTLSTNLRKRLPLIPLLACSLLTSAEAVSPPPDGGYPGGNTAEGQHALLDLTTGTYNTAVGLYSLLSNTTGKFNTGVGAGTLLTNTGEQNTAIGAGALLSNTTGGNNTANGESALFFNTTGGNSTAVGAGALLHNTTGGNNTATGFEALRDNTTGNTNVAMGLQALEHNTSGAENTALGVEAGRDQTTGSGNVYIGRSMVGVAGETNKTYIRNINTTNVSGGVADSVTVDLGTGLLGHLTSSRRYKEDIQPMDKASEALYRLKPVTYRYKKEIDRTQSPAFGLIAEQVADVNPDLVARNSQGQPESVHYEMVNAMLLNEFLKEHRRVEAQQATIAELKNEIETLVAHAREQDAKIQKVSERVERNKSLLETANNDQ